MRHTGPLLFLALCTALCIPESCRPQSSPSGSPAPLPSPPPGRDAGQPAVRTGEIIASVQCMMDTAHSYALYIPSAYTPDRRWPIVYVFDPAARGSLPLRHMKDAAERHGYIVAGSNNSRNGPWKPMADAAQAMWKDTHLRLSIDDRLVSFAGFSGGARVSALLAQNCRCAQGVFLNGAGFPPDAPPQEADSFAVFCCVGLLDMNYREMVELDEKLGSLRKAHSLRRFEGTHQWAPPEVWDEGFAWMKVNAMRDGRTAVDTQFVATQLERLRLQAQRLEDSGDAYFAWQAYCRIAELFGALADIRLVKARIAALEAGGSVEAGKEEESDEIALEDSWQREVRAAFNPPAPEMTGRQENDPFAAGRISPQIQVRIVLDRLRKEVESEERRGRSLALERARSAIVFTLNQAGNDLMQSGRLKDAKVYFDFVVRVKPAAPEPYIALARCLALMDENDDAVEELGLARRAGLSADGLAALLKTMPELRGMADNPLVQRLLQP